MENAIEDSDQKISELSKQLDTLEINNEKDI